MEFIAQPTPPSDELQERRFTFKQGSRKLSCEWALASPRLLSLAEVVQPASGKSPGNLRNLGPFGFTMAVQRKLPEKLLKPLIPWSFWIRHVDFEEQELVPLAQHLNLYMRYFDQDTPIIAVHAEPVEELSVSATPDPLSQFPIEVAAREIDAYLLGLWESAAFAQDTMRRFLYHYQILEYAAFFLRDKTLETIRKSLVAPDTPARLTEVAREVLDCMVDDRIADEAKIAKVIERFCDPQAVWKEIEPNRNYFSQPVSFDGGFSLPALLHEDWQIEDFRRAWMPKLPDALRQIRNALVHAREARMAKSILPTKNNLQRLRPWIPPLSRIAMQIMIFRE